jgi:hypothetical protein
MKYEMYKRFLTLYKDKIRFSKLIKEEEEIFSNAEKAILAVMPNLQIPEYKIYKIPRFLLLEKAAWINSIPQYHGKKAKFDVFITHKALNDFTAFHIILHELIHTLEVEKINDSSIQEFFVEIFAVWITINDEKYKECLPMEFMKYQDFIKNGLLFDISTAFEKFVAGDIKYLEKEYEKLILKINEKK